MMVRKEGLFAVDVDDLGVANINPLIMQIRILPNELRDSCGVEPPHNLQLD